MAVHAWIMLDAVRGRSVITILYNSYRGKKIDK